MKGAHPTLIDDLVGSPDREYGYQDHQYFLDSASGPWPGPLSWEYDRIGNRVSETRDANTDDYSYTPGTSGHTALLDHIDLAVGGTRDYGYSPAGHVEDVTAGGNAIDFLIDQEGRLAGLERPSGDAASSMVYDGRGFLSRVESFELSTLFRDGFERGTTECWSDGVPTPPAPGEPCTSATRIVEPLYDSAGLLHVLHIEEPFPAGALSDERVLYLAGRPVAIVRGELGDLDLLYLTTDHLGTPIAACHDSGALQWSGGFEPFGADWQETPTTGASAAGVWLRLPGQWNDDTWRQAGFGASLSQNVLRFYEVGTGRYQRPDPIGLLGGANPMAYVYGQPLYYVDPLGLDAAQVCCRPLEPTRTWRTINALVNLGSYGLVQTQARHCYVRQTNESGKTVRTWSLINQDGTALPGRNHEADFQYSPEQGECSDPVCLSEGVEKCLDARTADYPVRAYPRGGGVRAYTLLGGTTRAPNSKSAQTLTGCGVNEPNGISDRSAPGWYYWPATGRRP